MGRLPPPYGGVSPPFIGVLHVGASLYIHISVIDYCVHYLGFYYFISERVYLFLICD